LCRREREPKAEKADGEDAEEQSEAKQDESEAKQDDSEAEQDESEAERDEIGGGSGHEISASDTD